MGTLAAATLDRVTAQVPPSDPEDMHSRPGHLIRRAQQVHGYLWTAMVSKDVTPTQFSAITVIAARPGTDQIALSRESGLDTSTTGAVIQRLIQRGWVAVDRDPKDMRRKLLSLTPEGQRVFDEVAVRAASMTDRMVESLELGERAQLVSLLARLVAHGETLREAGDEAPTA
ncbi:MarR family winged helix-turn-helix transcriptional regulator [Salinibacterium hongtaonis]|uniref:MarR family transcriptional regulator n=1 Tax=Homoserinimonas hongtaonis TaxID=2079791 RepID=A0A2U1T2D1_9MICO|nr:MarR family transcriptional regulator [Salinibacterium hongtaonis]AWB88289.1 MarR family transcriptional regulator [Salinibacterium hongtaonis]PWB98044.1 MarR family transcriptional regulator [Salinibacterium hongtaonis]